MKPSYLYPLGRKTKWWDLVPEDVAIEQDAWERRKAVMRAMEYGGASVAGISRATGMSNTLVRAKWYRGLREDLSPVDRFFMKEQENFARLTRIFVKISRRNAYWGYAGRRAPALECDTHRI